MADMQPGDLALADQAGRELDEIGNAVVVEMHPATANALLAVVQIGLRHPGTKGLAAAEYAREVAERIGEQLTDGGKRKALATVIALGWVDTT